jgi:hypothetical protein
VPVPKDPDEFRLALVRRIHTFLRDWRSCDVPICKRSRACRGRSFACAKGEQTPTSPRQTARIKARMQMLLRKKREEFEIANADRAAAGERAPHVNEPCETESRVTAPRATKPRVTR